VRVVIKVGSSSVTDSKGVIDQGTLLELIKQMAALMSKGNEVVLVSSGAISAGLKSLRFRERPSDQVTLRAAAAVGQGQLIATYREILAKYQVEAAQLLMIPGDFADRSQYLHARETLSKLLELGVLPVINENDALSNEQLRYGDNDKVAALVANLIAADHLVLLTDQSGLYSADPRHYEEASLIEEVEEVNAELLEIAGAAGTERGSGGMASKLLAAKMASWSGVMCTIASAKEPEVVLRVVEGEEFLGTKVLARPRRLSARKLWIAFACPTSGEILVDKGAKEALMVNGGSLLPAGVVAVKGTFESGSAVSVTTEDGDCFAKGIVQMPSEDVLALRGVRSKDLTGRPYLEVIHRDDLVLLL
jgi:glutamate 5-kinase